MAYEVKLYILEEESKEPTVHSKIAATKGESYANFKVRLKDGEVLDWSFEYLCKTLYKSYLLWEGRGCIKSWCKITNYWCC